VVRREILYSSPWLVAHLALSVLGSDRRGDWCVEDREIWLGVRVVVAQGWRHCAIETKVLSERLAVIVSEQVRERRGELLKVKILSASSLPFTTHIGQARVETRAHVNGIGTGHRSGTEW
jgi:hypothetical protein